MQEVNLISTDLNQISIEPNLVQEGFTLLFYGMGFVFVFLSLLVVATLLMSHLVMRFSSAEPSATPEAKSSSSASNTDSNLIAAITAAIHLHRQR